MVEGYQGPSVEQVWACVLVDECGYKRVDLEVVGRTVGDWEGRCFLQEVEG